MKKQILLISIMLGLMINISGQTIDLTFTAEDDGTYVQLDSIKVMNRTQGGDTVLLYELDTVLRIPYVGIPEISKGENSFQVFQNYPNPVLDQTTISIFVPERDEVDIMVTDMLGRVMLKDERVLDLGTHSFRFRPGEGKLYFFTAQWRGNCSSIKILCSSSCSDGTGLLEYSGSDNSSSQLKTTEAVQDLLFSLGDTLLYIGYTNTLQSGILDAPEASDTCTFQFATNIPCPGTPTVTYEGQVYNTIQVFSQCWLKENLNVGTMIQGAEEMTDNGIMEKYCYYNLPSNCNTYGGLYQWNEMMQYTIQHGVQGICPPGWHLPTHEESKVLEGAVDSQYGIGHPEWDQSETWRGFDAGANLKTTSGWLCNNGTDLFGFSVKPAGIRYVDGLFYYLGEAGDWYTSVETINGAWSHGVASWFYGEAAQWDDPKVIGDGVRCLRNY